MPVPSSSDVPAPSLNQWDQPRAAWIELLLPKGEKNATVGEVSRREAR